MKFTEGLEAYLAGAVVGFIAYCCIVRPCLVPMMHEFYDPESWLSLVRAICILVGGKAALCFVPPEEKNSLLWRPERDEK